ncbi:MAG: outer membrane protein assembly factor BamB family protein [Gemmatimonadales bacterium]
MSKRALSVALLLGSVNAACAHGMQAPATPAVLAPDSTLASLGAPEQVWRAKAGRRFTGRLVVSGETIYGGSVDRKVYALNLANGEQLWSSRLGGLIAGGVLVAGDTVLAASSRPEGRVYALEARTGRRIWRTTIGPVTAPLALVDSVVVAETQRGDIVGLDRRTGAVRWRRRLGPARVPAVPGDSGTLIVATVDSLFRLSVRDGRVVGRMRSPGAVVSPWIESRGLLVAGTTDSLVAAVDRDSLRVRWQVRLDAPVLGSPAAAGDTLFAASRRGGLFRIVGDSAPTATRIADLDWPVTSPVAVVGGLVFVGGADGLLRALHFDGQEAWHVQLRWPVELAPLALNDGLLAVGGGGDLHRYRR